MSGKGDNDDIPQISLVKAGADVQALNWPFLCGLVATLLGDHSLWKRMMFQSSSRTMFHQPCQLHDSLCHNGIGAVQVSYSSLFQKWRKGSLSEKTLNADSLSGTIFCSLLPIWPVFSDDHVLADSSLSAHLPSLVPNLCTVLVAMNVVIWLMFHEARCLLLVCWC